MTTLAPKENPIIATEIREITIKDGIGDLSTIVNNLGIRKSYLDGRRIGTFREGDVFTLEIKNDGTATLTKKRDKGLEPGERKINEAFQLQEAAIYKNNEPGPSAFPHISFIRNAKASTYTLADYKGLPTNITIKTKDLDEFKREVNAISGKIVTECSSRKSQWELACEITHNKPFENNFKLNSTNFLDFFSKDINMTNLAGLANTDGKKLLEELIRSFYASVK